MIVINMGGKASDWNQLSSELLQHATRTLSCIWSYIQFPSRITSCRCADWTSLSPDLVRLIAGRLTNIVDYISFRSVCVSWRSAACPTDLPPQLPWLITPCEGSCTITFYSPSESRYYKFAFPGINNLAEKWIYGSSHGWLVLVDKDCPRPAVFLLNPITRAHKHLPPLPEKHYILSKALLCYNPSVSPLLQQLMVIIWSNMKMFFFRHGDDKWEEIEVPCSSLCGSMVYYEKRVYGVDDYGRLAVIDVASSSSSLSFHILVAEIEELANFLFAYVHLVEVTGNLFLMAWRRKSMFQLFRLDRSQGELKWVPAADGIGQNTILTSLMQSVSVPLVDGRGNQIYLFGNKNFYEKQVWDREVAWLRSREMVLPRACRAFAIYRTVPSLH